MDKQKPNQSATWQIRIVNVLIIVGIILYILYFVVAQIQLIRDYRTRDTWVTTQGIVIEPIVRGRWLAYEYQVDDVNYRSTRLTLTDTTSGTETDWFNNNFHLRFEPEYDTGSEVTVYYNPVNPSRAALFTDADFRPQIIHAIGISVLLVFVLLLRWAIKRYFKLIEDFSSGKFWNKGRADISES